MPVFNIPPVQAKVVEGYAKLGHAYLWLYAIVNTICGIVTTAALLLFSASLLGYFIPIELPIHYPLL